jgi:dihydropteroate synthase
MSKIYYQPIPDPEGAFALAGGWVRFSAVSRLRRGEPATRLAADAIDAEALHRLTAPRAALAGIDLETPRIMGILNTTPDSFSDGGLFDAPEAAHSRAQAMVQAGADILDIGGESTRPGAREVPVAEEISRTTPIISRLRAEGCSVPISIDTRKASVARAALDAGAKLINDVSAFTFDPAMAALVRDAGAPACLMHAQGSPETMQTGPVYDDPLLDIYDYLEARISALEAAGLARETLLVDPGIGFGKTLGHNLAVLRGIAVFHGLGCGILLGASRKRFIGTLTDTEDAADRVAGSVAVALHGVAQGVQVLRVHDVEETRQALTVWSHLTWERDL